MALTNRQLADLVAYNPHVVLAYNDPDSKGEKVVIQTSRLVPIKSLALPESYNPDRVILRRGPLIKIRVLPEVSAQAGNKYQDCQNEPISLGTQIKPYQAQWVGTAGAPCRWTDAQGEPHWGILSNWHVFCSGRYGYDYPMHQPLDDRPACAKLFAWTDVKPNEDMYCDAAIADAFIDGYHTIDWSILDIGTFNPVVGSAIPGNTYIKVGRTTGWTHARCEAIGVAVQVGYGDFTATFVDQDLFVDIDEPFSAPGDSGSLIICTCNNGPSSLLFAGGDNQTIGNPLKRVQDRLPIRFDK